MKKRIKFSLKFDDDNHTLSSEDGLPFDKLAILLKDLFDVIDSKTGIKCTLGQIRGNCYALDFYTDDEALHSNFIVVHKNLEQHTEIDLRNKEQKYGRTLKSILGDKLYLKAYDKEGKEIAKLKQLTFQQEVEHYFTTQTVYGIFCEHGGKDLSAKPHILISGQEYKVHIKEDQDLSLKPYYKTHEIKFRLRQKKSSKDGHIISAELLSFEPKSDKSLLENIKEIDVNKLNVLKNINTNEDVIRKLYG
jgi:hypothetical protein